MDNLNSYKIEQKIVTLSSCAVMENKEKPASFKIDDVEFSHLDFNYRDGWVSDSWIASFEIKSENLLDAINYFLKEKLAKIIPRISLISQAYIEYINEPFIVEKGGSEIVYFRYTYEFKAVGLMFMEKEQKALLKLMENKEISDTFYYYWNDAVNAYGYSQKLGLMFSAIECLVKKNGKKDWVLVNEILGKELSEDLYGTAKNPSIGLRHRFIHGEYFKQEDHSKNYFEEIHKKVIAYFNKKVLLENLIEENVIGPQRNFNGNKKGGAYLLKSKDGSNIFNLKVLIKDFEKSSPLKPEKYEFVYDKTLYDSY